MSNRKQFTITDEMLTTAASDQRWPDVAEISARLSKFAFVLFCYITNHLMTGPLGNNESSFPRISMFPEAKSRETLRFSRNKIHCSPWDQSLSVKYSTGKLISGVDSKVCFVNILIHWIVTCPKNSIVHPLNN